MRAKRTFMNMPLQFVTFGLSAIILFTMTSCSEITTVNENDAESSEASAANSDVQYSKDKLADRFIQSYNSKYPEKAIALESVTGRPTAAYYQTRIDFEDGFILEIGYGDGAPYYSLLTKLPDDQNLRTQIINKGLEVFPLALEYADASFRAAMDELSEGNTLTDYFEDGYSEMYMSLHQNTIDNNTYELTLNKKTW